ncbi:MAG TPA: hypothetical protein VLO07_01995, partial [Thermoanaerobaculia bacterium]|nr:hypothetical protein [Thermoanaerobaculia bacterium]
MKSWFFRSVIAVMWLCLGAAIAVDQGKKGAQTAAEDEKPAMEKIVVQIQKADYEDDRKALASLAGELTPYTENGPLASRARYWRGFAMWRRALNGFNDNVDPKELEKDLTDAVSEFTAAAKDPGFADAKVGASSCLFTLSYLSRNDAERRKAYITQGIHMMGEMLWSAAIFGRPAQDNPRFLWV